MSKNIEHVARFMNPLPEWKIIGYYDVLKDKEVENPRYAWGEIIIDESGKMISVGSIISGHRIMVEDDRGKILNYNILTNELYDGNTSLNKKVYALTYIDGYVTSAYGKRLNQKFFKRILCLGLPVYYSPENTLYHYKKLPYTMMELVHELDLNENCEWLNRRNSYYCAIGKEQIQKFMSHYIPEYEDIKSEILEITWDHDFKSFMNGMFEDK